MHEQHGDGAFPLDLHGGSAPTTIQWYAREETSLPVAVQRWELPPGGSEGMHRHPPGEGALEELYLLVEGRAVMHVDGRSHEMAPGDAVLAAAGSDHDLHNPGLERAVLVVVWGPPAGGLDWTRFATGRAAHAAAGRQEDR